MAQKKKTKGKPHYVDVHVGERLRFQRCLKGFSQDKLGKIIENPITFQQIQKYEKGTNRISCSRLWEFAQVLDLESPAWFFEGLEQAEFTSPVEIAHNKETVRLLKYFTAIENPKARQAVKNLMISLADSKANDDLPFLLVEDDEQKN